MATSASRVKTEVSLSYNPIAYTNNGNSTTSKYFFNSLLCNLTRIYPESSTRLVYATFYTSGDFILYYLYPIFTTWMGKLLGVSFVRITLMAFGRLSATGNLPGRVQQRTCATETNYYVLILLIFNHVCTIIRRVWSVHNSHRRRLL